MFRVYKILFERYTPEADFSGDNHALKNLINTQKNV